MKFRIANSKTVITASARHDDGTITYVSTADYPDGEYPTVEAAKNACRAFCTTERPTFEHRSRH